MAGRGDGAGGVVGPGAAARQRAVGDAAREARDEAARRGGRGEVARRVARDRADRAAAGLRALGERARELRAALVGDVIVGLDDREPRLAREALGAVAREQHVAAVAQHRERGVDRVGDARHADHAARAPRARPPSPPRRARRRRRGRARRRGPR